MSSSPHFHLDILRLSVYYRDMELEVNLGNDGLRCKEEKVLAAAESCFIRYGFRKTTMSDIASAAEISRPALYLMYNSKESIFRDVVGNIFDTMLLEIRDGMNRYQGPSEQLQVAFEVWCVRPFEIVQNAPDAADLLENSRQLSTEAWNRGIADFEALIAQVLGTVQGDKHGPAGPSTARVAHLLASAVLGLKESAGSVAELRVMIQDLIDLVVSGLAARTE